MRDLLLYVIVVAILIGCKDPQDCSLPTNYTVDQARLLLEVETIDKYILDSAITAQAHETGIRYIIHTAGTGNSADMCSYVTKQYALSMLDGTTIVNFLGGVTAERSALALDMAAWQIGIPLVQEGGLITLFVPSPLGYGNVARTFNNNGLNVTVPPNTSLIFTIAVMKVE